MSDDAAKAAALERARALNEQLWNLGQELTLAAASMLPPPWGTAADVYSFGRDMNNWLYNGGSGWDAFFSAVGVVPVLGDAAKGARMVGKVGDLANEAAHVAGDLAKYGDEGLQALDELGTTLGGMKSVGCDTFGIKQICSALGKIDEAKKAGGKGQPAKGTGADGPSGGGFDASGRPLDSDKYSVVYEAELTAGTHFPGKSDRTHFQESNRQLHDAMQSDPSFAAALEARYPGLTSGVAPGPRGAHSSRPPIGGENGLTWHHHPDRPGIMQLVPSAQHQAPGAVQQSLHPNRQGGMERWGGGR